MGITTIVVEPLEAITQGCAVLASSLEWFTEFVHPAETGFIFDRRKSEPAVALARKVEQLVADEPLLGGVAEFGDRKSSDDSIGRVADSFLNAFHFVMQESHVGNTSR